MRWVISDIAEKRFSSASSVNEAAASSKEAIAVKTLGPINESAVDFLRELGCREQQTACLLVPMVRPAGKLSATSIVS